MKINDLKRGMRCTERSGLQYIIDEVKEDKITFIYPVGDDYSGVCHINEDLTSDTLYDYVDIMKVEDIAEDGYEVIWEREDPKYYLRLPEPLKHVCTYLNLNVDTGTYGLADKEEIEGYRTKFTQNEIDELPSQEFIRSLIKEEVE